MNLPSKRVAPLILLLSILAAALPLAAKNAPRFKTIVVQHFTNANGVNQSQDFIHYFCDTMRDQLQKYKIASQVVEEGTAVADADAPNSIVIEGKFTSFDQGGMFRKLGVEIDIYRISDHALMKTIAGKAPFAANPFGNVEKNLARSTGPLIAYQIKQALKSVNLSSIPPAPPGANPAAPALASAPVSAASQTGPKLLTSIQFTSDPTGADITIDGNYAGNTPSLIKLKPGTHSIKMTKSGCTPWVRSIEIAAGESRTIAAELEPQK